jgi:hypothetical protein
VILTHYFNREGPRFKKLGLKSYQFGQLPFDVVYLPDEIIPKSMPGPEPVLVFDFSSRKEVQLDNFIAAYERHEVSRALRRNLSNLNDPTPTKEDEEEELASIGDEFGLTDDENSQLF